VWLYFRFELSFRDIEELMASRGIIVTHETIRQWTLKFGQRYANELRPRQPQRGDKWGSVALLSTKRIFLVRAWAGVMLDGPVPSVRKIGRQST
jgi:putative transposase